MTDTPSAWALKQADKLAASICKLHGKRYIDEIALALDAAYRAGIEAATALMDERAVGCRNIAETIRQDWIGPNNSEEDNRANAQDRIEHLNRIPLYKGAAESIRALPAPETDA